MQKLLELASKAADQAEVYSETRFADNLSFVNGKIKNTDVKIKSGLALRIIKDGRIGFAYTKNLINRKELVEQALQSAIYGKQVNFSFPTNHAIPQLNSYNPELINLDKEILLAESERVFRFLNSQIDTQKSSYHSINNIENKIINSNHTESTYRKSYYFFSINVYLQNILCTIGSPFIDQNFQTISDAKLSQLIELVKISKQLVTPCSSKKTVIFTQNALNDLLNRFRQAVNPVNFDNKTSPLFGKLGEKIFSKELTILQNPLNDSRAEATPFDHEGTPCKNLTFVENGILKELPTDLYYAAKLGLPATGNGFRPSIEQLPEIQTLLELQTGNATLADMINSVNDGMLIYSLTGAHGGNVLNGDFSAGVSAGFVIQNGLLTGSINNCMISGNIYDLYNRVQAVENEVSFVQGNYLPAILIDCVSVTGK